MDGLKLLIDLCYMCILLLFNVSCIYQISTSRLYHNDTLPLIDIIQHYTPDTLFRQLDNNTFKILKDILCFLPTIILAWVLPFEQFLHIIEVSLFMGTIRPFFFYSTILPMCNKRKQINNIWQCFSGGNHDLIFSGHAAWMIYNCHSLEHFNITPFTWFWYMYSIFFSVILVAMREHYTIDIIVSSLVVYWCNSIFPIPL